VYTPINQLRAGQTVIEDDGFGLKYDIVSVPYREEGAAGWFVRVRSMQDGHEDVYFEGDGFEGYCKLVLVTK
jgi:hypothetical protein